MACRKDRCPGSGRSRWSQYPSPIARARFAPFLVSQHAGEDHVGQAPLEGAHGHHGRPAAGPAGVVVGAALGRVPQLHDGHDVQGPGDAPAERAPPLGAADKGGAPSTLRAQNRSVCRVMICPGFSQDYPLMPKVVLSQGSWGCLIQCAAFSSLTYR